MTSLGMTGSVKVRFMDMGDPERGAGVTLSIGLSGNARS